MERSKQKFVTIFDPKTPVDFVGKGKIAVIIGFGLSIVTLLGFAVLGVNWGIDFAGGTEMQVKFAKDVPPAEVKKLLEEEGFQKHQVQAYGDAANHEILMRVERITTTTDEDIAKIKGLLGQALAADLKGQPPQIDFIPSEGDRIHVVLPVPASDAAQAGDDPAAAALGMATAQQRALEAQQATVAKVIEEQSGLKLRRTKNADTNVESSADAIVRDEPYQGKVHYLVQFQGVTDKLQRALTTRFGDAEIRRVDFVDASVAAQLRTDGLLALVFAMLGILVYVAIRFDFFFAPGAIIALAHDPIGAMAVFAFGRVEFDLPSIAALLTIVGYSITNTIVIYDRIRETTPVTKVPLTHEEMSALVNTAVNDTLSRTINATLTTFLTALAVAMFTDGAVRNFAIVLCLGIVLGAFSSTFVAPAIYLFFRKRFFIPDAEQKASGPTREERARGIV